MASATGTRAKAAPKRNGSAVPPSSKDEQPAATVQLPLFEMSSQFRNWRYSVAGLAKARQDLNATAVKRVRSMLQEERDTTSTAPETSNANASNGDAAAPPPPPSEVQYLTVKDEQALVTYYLAQIARLCKAFRFPNNVESTAMTYLKRFYLRNTCMDYHPKNVMLTCLFLSTKTENHVKSIGDFTSKIPNCSDDDVLALEFLVSQSLKFQFKVHHAYLAGRGIAMDLQTLITEETELNDFVEVTVPQAQATINQLRLTDAEFLYTPSQIALAAYHLHAPSLAERWLASKIERRNASTLRSVEAKKEEEEEQKKMDRMLSDLKQTVLVPVQDLIEQASRSVDVEAVREVDRRLRYCKNPEKDPSSSLYKKRQAERENELSTKKAKKDQTLRGEQEANNPFA